MLKIISFSLVTVFFFVSGMFEIVRFFLYSQASYSLLHFALGIGLFIAGVFVFIVTRKAILARVAEREKAEGKGETVVVGSNDILSRNNAMINDWEKTNTARDRLKMLQMSGSTEEEGS